MSTSWLKIVVGILTVALFCSSCAKKQTPTPSTAEPNRPAQPKVVAPEPSATGGQCSYAEYTRGEARSCRSQYRGRDRRLHDHRGRVQEGVHPANTAQSL